MVEVRWDVQVSLHCDATLRRIKKIAFFVHNVMGRGGSVSDKRVKIWSDPLKSRDKHYWESVVGPQGWRLVTGWFFLMPLCESQREELLISFWTWLEYRTWDIRDIQDLITNRVPTVGLYSNHGMYFSCCSSQILMNTNKNPKQWLNSASGVGQIWSVLFVCLHCPFMAVLFFLRKL